MMRIQHETWQANGRAHSCRIGSLVLIARWPRFWFVLQYSPMDRDKEFTLVNLGPLIPWERKYRKFAWSLRRKPIWP